MLDIVFWWCAMVALAGSAALVGLALSAGRVPRSQPTGPKRPRDEQLMMRHFGRA
jgi:hypothetical protein